MKRMKTLIKNILLAVPVILSASCSDWLEEDPKTFISPSSFYQTVEDFDGALKGLYPHGQNLNLTEVFADYNDKPESAEQVGDIWANNPGYGFYAFRNAWSGPYSTIKNANMILESIEDKDFTAETKNRIIGEAKCLRAWSYFTLVQFFGDVPLRDKVVTSDADVAIDRTPQADIYQFIFDDILDAEQKPPEEAQDMGRVNKWVVKAIMARIYLTSAGFPMNQKENYAKAKEKALEVINSGQYSLMPTFDKVFKTERYTAETIWAQLFSAPDSYSGMHNESSPIGSQTALYLPTDAFIASFDKGDMRKEWGIKPEYVNAKGNKVIARTYYNKYINEEYLEQELPASNTNILTWQTKFTALRSIKSVCSYCHATDNIVSGNLFDQRMIGWYDIRRKAGKFQVQLFLQSCFKSCIPGTFGVCIEVNDTIETNGFFSGNVRADRNKRLQTSRCPDANQSQLFKCRFYGTGREVDIGQCIQFVQYNIYIVRSDAVGYNCDTLSFIGTGYSVELPAGYFAFLCVEVRGNG